MRVGSLFSGAVLSGHVFLLEVANTDAAIEKGLSGRKDIPTDGGMLFIFPGPVEVQSLWMYRCLVDIDAIFIGQGGQVTAVHRMLQGAPQRDGESESEYQTRLLWYSSASPAAFAIELRAGWLNRLALGVGDRVVL